MSTIKDLLEKIALRAGYQVIPKWQMEDFQTVRYIRKLFNRLDINLVIDIGANAGQYRDVLRNRVGYRGRIISVEPIPELAQGLTARAANEANWTVHNMALGSSVGTATFNVMSNTEFSSFRTPKYGNIDLSKDGNKISRQVEVRVSTLDNLANDLNVTAHKDNIYVKLDTQGYDLEVLKGGLNFIKKVSLIQTEASVIPIYEGSPAYTDLIKFLTDQDFVLSGMYLNNEGHFPILVEFDCFMIRRDLAMNAGQLRADA